MRRTTSIDLPWPDYDNLLGVIHVCGRDLLTPESGEPTVIRTLDANLTADLMGGRIETIEGVATSGPGGVAWSDLVGATLRSGFARFLAEHFVDASAARTLAFSAFDDLPGAFLVSGYSMIRNGMLPEEPERGPERAAHQADVCAGWATGSSVHTVLAELGRMAIPYGPVAPPLAVGDVDGWHALPPLEPRAVRRQRQLDVAYRDDGGLDLQSHFRDSYVAEDHHMVMHEYLVHAVVDSSRRITQLEVEPRVLPWAECPGAVSSSRALVGARLSDLQARVRAELAGPVGCTHLSSTLRTLADAGALSEALDHTHDRDRNGAG